MDRAAGGAVPLACLGLVLVAGCLPRSGEPYQRQTDDDAGPQGPVQLDAGTIDDRRALPNAAPHAVLSVAPNHGPFTGGQTVLVRGNGFTSDVRVWFGDERVPSEDVLPVDPGRIQVTVPEGAPGAVDVVTQNGTDTSTRAALTKAYIYDAFYLEPSSGPTSGGTEITLHGSGTQWDDETEVLIDLVPCDEITVHSEEELTCKTPAGSPGSKNVRVITQDDVETDVLDAFVYGDSDSGFRGGLSGQPLDRRMTVTVLDDVTGSPVAGAAVILDDGDESSEVTFADSRGVAVFSDADLGPTRTVTVAAKCFSPITFVDVPVDTVNVYLDPVLDLSCADLSEIPQLPGSGRGSGSSVRGELLWPSSTEFGRGGWTNVPPAKGGDERQVAYVFRAMSSATRAFSLPSNVTAVTPSAPGEAGYSFYLPSLPGNATYYALAGIENRSLSPPLFTAYSMGLVTGVTTAPDTTTTDVFIRVDVPLDHTLKLEITPPKTTARGPDRIQANVVLRLSEAGYAVLPNGRQSRLLPGSAQFDFVGMPTLSGSLTGAQYVTFASAVTGDDAAMPDSFGGLFATTDSSQPIVLDEFVEVPELQHPEQGTRWDGRELRVDWAAGGVPVDLVVFDIASGGGLVTWTVAAPGDVRNVALPNLKAVSSELGLMPGSLSIRVSAARIRDFAYGSLRYRQLGPNGFDAFARDVFRVSY